MTEIREFPSPRELWSRYRREREIVDDRQAELALVDNNWESTGASVGPIVDHYPLTLRPGAVDLAAYLQWQGGGRIYAGVASTGESLYINDARPRVAAQVTQLRVGSRRLMIPPHGYVAVGWSFLSPAPSISAITDDGSVLASLNLAQEPGAHRHPRGSQTAVAFGVN